MVNKVMVIGNLGQDPQIKEFDNGNKIANFSVATSERYKNRDGEQVDETEWHNVSCFGKLAELVEQYLHKGSKVYVEGKLKTRSYDKDGVEMYRTEINAREIKFLSKVGEDSGDIV